jgi:hypothetical protein
LAVFDGRILHDDVNHRVPHGAHLQKKKSDDDDDGNNNLNNDGERVTTTTTTNDGLKKGRGVESE